MMEPEDRTNKMNKNQEIFHELAGIYELTIEKTYSERRP